MSATPAKNVNNNAVSTPGDQTPNLQSMFVDGIIGACKSVSVYEKLNRIGEGTYGVVYRARDKLSGKIYALKKVRMEREKDGLPLTSLREIRILRSISHPNIVTLHEVVVGKEIDNIYLVFEYVEHDLAGLIDNMRTPFTESEVKCLILQLLKALAYLHDRWIIHRDLKLSNLLFNNRGQLKLADFGLARLYGTPLKQYTPKVVTLWYRGPELLLGDEYYSTALDIWSVGCVFGELLMNLPILRGKNEIDQLTQIFNLLGTPNERIWPGYSSLPNAKKIIHNQPYSNLRSKFAKLSSEGFDLLNRMLTYDPKKRITAKQALTHPYFSERPLPKDPEMMPTFPTRFDEVTKQDYGYKGKRKNEGTVERHDNETEDNQFGRFNGELFSASSTTEVIKKKK